MAPKWARLAPDLYNLGPFLLNLRATLTCQLAAIDKLLDGSAADFWLNLQLEMCDHARRNKDNYLF